MADTDSDNRHIPDMVDMTIARVRSGLLGREFTCVQLCKVYLARIAEVNDKYNAVIQTHPRVMDIAASRDEELRSKGDSVGRLHGAPILVKSLFHVDDSIITSAGSISLIGAYGVKSTAVSKLEAEGAIILGTTNLSEFSNLRGDLCPDGWSPLGGQCYGVYAKNQNPSGSSSGSAVAARLGLAVACLGTENNGSITSPAAHSACIGYKPSVGLVSRTGVISFNKYQDCPGVLARTVEDARTIVAVMAGYDPDDPITSSIPDSLPSSLSHPAAREGLQGVRLAVPRASIHDSVNDPEILSRFDESLDMLRAQGATIVDNVRYPTWTREFSRQTRPFVWGQLRESLDGYLQTLRSNPHNIRSLSELWSHMQTLPAERASALGASRFEKALMTTPMNFEKVFASRLAKGSEIATILDENGCDALIIPEECSNPADLGQCPIVCVPMGFYPPSTQTSVDEFGLVWRAANNPFGLMFVGRKWFDAELCGVVASCFEVIRPHLEDDDKPIHLPKTELRDIVRAEIVQVGPFN